MIERCPVRRAGTPEEVGAVRAHLICADGAFITGSDFVIDGGATAA
jgi:NAD(P)-dependent dehydrogenase (short-subunit alcohol dehydrogenase family)